MCWRNSWGPHAEREEYITEREEYSTVVVS